MAHDDCDAWYLNHLDPRIDLETQERELLRQELELAIGDARREQLRVGRAKVRERLQNLEFDYWEREEQQGKREYDFAAKDA